MDAAPVHASSSSSVTRICRNRNKHPCDFCRYKRAACLINGPPPCQLCRRFDRDCTFLNRPNKRRRAQDTALRSPDFGGAQVRSPTEYSDGRSPGSGTDEDGSSMDGVEGEIDDDGDHHESNVENSRRQRESRTGSLGSDHKPPPNFKLPLSLDANPGRNAQIIGLTGESDPYLLRMFRFDERDECSFQQLRIRTMSTFSDQILQATVWGDASIPVQFMLQDNSLASKAQPQGFGPGTSETEIRAEIEAAVSNEVGRRLIRLFLRYVQPYFPVLSEEHTVIDLCGEPSAIPTCLLAAVYGHALPFCVFDDRLCVEVYTPPSADRLFQLAWMAALPGFHTPSLATVQTMILLIQRRPTNKHVADTPFKWVMLADVVALAQCLGLNVDPGSWKIPSWEKRLRRRLAWAVYVQDRWLSLTSARSSHIQDSDWDVAPLTSNDFSYYPQAREQADDHIGEPGIASSHFLHLASLTEIVSKIHQNLFSVKAARRLSNSLEATFEVARPLRIELAEWFQNRPTVAERPSPIVSQQDLDGNGSLRLAYIVAKITVFRALLRPDSSEVPAEARAALRTGATSVGREAHDFLAKLEAHHLEAFWHSYSRVSFAIASSFLVLLFATSPTRADADESLLLLTQWRSLLRIKSRSCDLLNLSLLRLDAMFVAGLGKLIDLMPNAAAAAADRGL